MLRAIFETAPQAFLCRATGFGIHTRPQPKAALLARLIKLYPSGGHKCLPKEFEQATYPSIDKSSVIYVTLTPFICSAWHVRAGLLLRPSASPTDRLTWIKDRAGPDGKIGSSSWRASVAPDGILSCARRLLGPPSLSGPSSCMGRFSPQSVL